MNNLILNLVIVAVTTMACLITATTVRAETLGWTDAFKTQRCSTWTPTGSNMYWNLIPRHQASYAGVDTGGAHLKISVMVTNQVKVMPDGIPTRVVNDTVVDTQSGALKFY